MQLRIHPRLRPSEDLLELHLPFHQPFYQVTILARTEASYEITEEHLQTFSCNALAAGLLVSPFIVYRLQATGYQPYFAVLCFQRRLSAISIWLSTNLWKAFSGKEPLSRSQTKWRTSASPSTSACPRCLPPGRAAPPQVGQLHLQARGLRLRPNLEVKEEFHNDLRLAVLTVEL